MKRSERIRRFTRALVTRTLDFDFELVPFRLENISARKLLALFRSELNCARSRPGTPWYPVQLQVEPSTACSLHCPLCPAGIEKGPRPHANMPFETFRSLMDEVGDHAVIAVMWMWGEPFMNRKLPDLIACAHGKNVATVTSTNGQHVQTREEAEALVASGLDCLIVALDGASQDVYSQYRVGGDINRIFRCMELVRQAKLRLGSAKPIVNVRTVVMKHNEHQLDDIAQIGRRLGAEYITRKTACMADYCGSDTDERFAPSDPRYRRFQYKDGKRVRKSIQEFRCRRPWNRMTVCSDGTLISCEFDYDREAPFGQAGEEGSLLRVWRKASEFRRRFMNDRKSLKFCLDCHYRDRSSDECVAEILPVTR